MLRLAFYFQRHSQFSSELLPENLAPAFCRGGEGGFGRPESNKKDLSASGCDASGDLVEGRVGNLMGLNLRSSLKHFRQGLYDF